MSNIVQGTLGNVLTLTTSYNRADNRANSVTYAVCVVFQSLSQAILCSSYQRVRDETQGASVSAAATRAGHCQIKEQLKGKQSAK